MEMADSRQTEPTYITFFFFPFPEIFALDGEPALTSEVPVQNPTLIISSLSLLSKIHTENSMLSAITPSPTIKCISQEVKSDNRKDTSSKEHNALNIVQHLQNRVRPHSVVIIDPCYPANFIPKII